MRWGILVSGLTATAVAALVAAIWLRPVPAHGVASARPAPAARPSPAPTVAPLALPANARVLVFSPHPDDETLGVGGLLARLAHARVPLRIVFMTNGDGYRNAVQRDFDLTQPTDADYVALGEVRQREALRAVAKLGVKRSQVRFLGFPDGGLAELWRNHWLPSYPYTSPYTKESSPPDSDGIGYAGQDLTRVIARVLRDFRPTVVIMPHPYDVHLDHAHTSYFVTEALDEAAASRVLARPRVLTYLVHHPSWPWGEPPAFDRFVPIAGLPDTAWTETELAPAELAAKRAALAEYRSQLEVMQGFLLGFLRRNELFATVDGRVLERIAALH
jgi:LmbE family N-acetylglucosaminyl deacetylase